MLPWTALCLLLAAAPAEKPKLIVLDLTAQAGVEPDAAAALTDAVSAEVGAQGYFQAMSSRDIQTLLGVERQRKLLGCSEEGSCLTELAGAIGARFVLSGSVAKLGDAYQLTIQTLDSQKAGLVGRSARLARDLSGLRSQIPYAVAEATGAPLPAPPSHVLPYTLVAAGGALLIAGGVVGLHAVTEEISLQSEINQGQQLRTYPFYTQAQSQYGVERTLALVGLTAGAVAIAAGLYLNPDLHGGTHLALAPTVDGVALVGTWP